MPKRIDWSPETDALLGVLNDAELAQQIGCTSFAVWRRRHKLGIDPCPTASDKVDWSLWEHRLGHESDVALAKEMGVHRTTVLQARKRFGIPGTVRGNIRAKHEIRWADFEHLMGKILDGDLAEIVMRATGKKTTRGRVTTARRLRGIKALRPQRRWTEAEEAALMEATTIREFCKEHGRTWDAARDKRRRLKGAEND